MYFPISLQTPHFPSLLTENTPGITATRSPFTCRKQSFGATRSNRGICRDLAPGAPGQAAGSWQGRGGAGGERKLLGISAQGGAGGREGGAHCGQKGLLWASEEDEGQWRRSHLPWVPPRRTRPAGAGRQKQPRGPSVVTEDRSEVAAESGPDSPGIHPWR